MQPYCFNKGIHHLWGQLTGGLKFPNHAVPLRLAKQEAARFAVRCFLLGKIGLYRVDVGVNSFSGGEVILPGQQPLLIIHIQTTQDNLLIFQLLPQRPAL